LLVGRHDCLIIIYKVVPITSSQKYSLAVTFAVVCLGESTVVLFWLLGGVQGGDAVDVLRGKSNRVVLVVHDRPVDSALQAGTLLRQHRDAMSHFYSIPRAHRTYLAVSLFLVVAADRLQG
jgi:uncharacterized protein (DUF1810 family)